MKRYNYLAWFFIEDTRFGPRNYHVMFDITGEQAGYKHAVQTHYKSDSVSGLAGLINKELPNILAGTKQRKITVLPFSTEKRIANLEEYATIRPFDSEEQNYLKKKLENLGIKTRSRKI